MPSLTPDPTKALFDRLRSLESRLQALEGRRKQRRPWGWYSAGNGITYPASTNTPIAWDDYAEVVSMVNPFTGTFTIPFDGPYKFHFITPVVGTARTVECSIYRTNTSTTLASRDMAFASAVGTFYPWITVVSLNESDTVQFRVNPSGGSAILSTDATLLVERIG